MRKTARRARAEVLVWLTLAVACSGRPLAKHGSDGGAVDEEGGAGSVGRGDAGASGDAEASGDAGASGDAEASGSAGAGGSAATAGGAGTGGSAGAGGSAGMGGSAGTNGSAGTSGNAGTGGATSGGGAGGTGGASIGGAGGGGTGGAAGSGGGGGTQPDPKPAGAPCQVPSECASAFCFDGICCTSACVGPCRSCALAGSLGTCVPVATGSVDPRASCAQEAVTTCGRTGRCDGAGACQRYAAGTICANALCMGDTLTPAATCDGLGSCRTPPSVSCAPYGCNASAGTCHSGCPAGDTICPAGAYCTGDESCFPQKDPGVACGSNHECKSGYCVDGVCCGAACAFKCLSCTGSFGLGTCTALAAGTICAAATCADAVLMPARTCDGAGTCLPATPSSCAPYTCRADGPFCRTDCAMPANCLAGWTCMGGVCARS